MVPKQTQAERDAEGHAAWLANTSPFGARCHREMQLWARTFRRHQATDAPLEAQFEA